MIEFLYPTEEVFLVSQYFGERPQVYARFGLKGHNGMDFACRSGTPVRATAAGTVERTGSDPQGYGIYVVIRHTPELESLYAHLESRSVNVGDEVAPGTLIGRSGSSGFSTGPHLHFEIRQNGTAVDPRPLLLGGDVHVDLDELDIWADDELKVQGTVNSPLGLFVRAGPGVNYPVVAGLRPGERIRPMQLCTWWEISPGRWVAQIYMNQVLVTVEEQP